MKETEIQKEKSRRTVRGEFALMVAVAINSLGVVLMLHSGAGISAISSVPYAFSEVFTRVSLGTWTYIFQGLLGAKSHDPAEKICAAVSVQFCSGICIQRIIGCA